MLLDDIPFNGETTKAYEKCIEKGIYSLKKAE